MCPTKVKPKTSDESATFENAFRKVLQISVPKGKPTAAARVAYRPTNWQN